MATFNGRQSRATGPKNRCEHSINIVSVSYNISIHVESPQTESLVFPGK